jgi:hypothetical protein
MTKVHIEITKEQYIKTIQDITNVLKRQDKQIKDLNKRINNLENN